MYSSLRILITISMLIKILSATLIKPKIHLKVATVELAPFMMKKQLSSITNIDGRSKNVTGNEIDWHGYCIDFFEELIRNLPYDITYELYQVNENKFGSKVKHIISEVDNVTQKTFYRKTEKWTGLIGDLIDGKADLALAPLAVMAERELVIDFTVPFYDLVGIQILLKKPDVTRDIFKFLTVLDNEVWFSITIAFFVTSLVIFLFDRLSPYSHKNLTRIKKLKKQQLLDDELLPNKPDGSIYPGIDHSQVARFRKNIGEQMESRKSFQGSIHFTKRDNDLDINMRDMDRRGSSWTQSVRDAGRRSSVFLTQGLNSIFHRRDGAVHPQTNENVNPASVEQYQQGRGSRVLGDYLKQIDLRRGTNSSNLTDETDSTDIDDGKPDFGFKDSLWFCITSLTPQGGGEAPMNLSGRVVAGAWWLFCFIIIASYTANLAAFLTVSRLDIPIESLDDLVKQYRIKYAPVDGTAENAYFERMAYIEEIFYNIWRDMSLNESLAQEERSKFAVWDYPISDKYTKIWTQIQQVGMPIDHETGIQRVKSSTLEEGFALLADANTIKHAVITDCRVKAVGDEFSRKPIALGLRKGQDHFRDDLSHAILKLINQRFMEILREKWWTNNPERVICDDGDESEGIGIENIGGVFIIIAAGVLLSFLAWLIERIAYQTRINISRDLISS